MKFKYGQKITFPKLEDLYNPNELNGEVIKSGVTTPIKKFKATKQLKHPNIQFLDWSFAPKGYVRTTLVITPKKCDCGAEKTYGVGCGTHADWCSTNE